jgi:hypothetical protein
MSCVIFCEWQWLLSFCSLHIPINKIFIVKNSFPSLVHSPFFYECKIWFEVKTNSFLFTLSRKWQLCWPGNVARTENNKRIKMLIRKIDTNRTHRSPNYIREDNIQLDYTDSGECTLHYNTQLVSTGSFLGRFTTVQWRWLFWTH